MKRLWVIFSKEVTDNLRDKRSITSALITPLITPLFLVALIIVMGQTLFADPEEQVVRLPVRGAENAPGLITFLKQNNVQIVDAPADPESAARTGDVDLVLVIEDGYGKAFEAGEPAPVQLIADSSRQSAIRSISYIEQLLRQYANTIAVLRLQARGVNPQVISPLSVANVDVATPQSQALIFLNMMPFLMLMVIFTGAMYVIIDTTAGERERGSLEPLLINPATRAEFALGKLLASLPFGIVTLIMTMATYYLAFNVFPLEEFVNIPMRLDLGALVAIFLLSLPIVLLASALQLLVASFTRSFKEAQTYLGFLPLVAGFPSAFLAFLPVKASTGMMLIPTFGQAILINQMMRGEPVLATNLWISSAATLVLAVVVIGLSIWLYRREQILFGR
ncbi:MAG TPA: ABC transporter permease [Anaerolineaceae bacterium]